jgi:hypothetical protein
MGSCPLHGHSCVIFVIMFKSWTNRNWANSITPLTVFSPLSAVSVSVKIKEHTSRTGKTNSSEPRKISWYTRSSREMKEPDEMDVLVRRTVHVYDASWALLEEPPIVQPLKNFPAFYGTRRFNTVFTRALHWFLFWAISIQSTPSHPISLRSILILSTHLRLGHLLKILTQKYI